MFHKSKPYNHVISYRSIIFAILLFISLLFYKIGVLTSWIVEIFSIIAILGTIIVVIWGSLYRRRVSQIKRIAAISSFILSIFLAGALLYSLFAVWFHIAPIPTKWQAAFTQSIPFCSSSTGTLWNAPLPGTKLSCANLAGLEMIQSSKAYYGEVDLTRINNQSSYHSGIFRVQTQVNFTKSTDRGTFAGLLIKSTQTTDFNGYVLLINSSGSWQIQKIMHVLPAQTIASGTISTLNQSIIITITIYNGNLFGTINNQQVIYYSSTNLLDPSQTTIGLIAAQLKNAVPSSPVIYSQFELDTPA